MAARLASSLGKKYLMALSGCALFLFVIAHLLGNLQIFLGPEALNRYGHFLQTTPELLWPARLGLMALVVVHIVCAVKLTAENRAARPVPYAQHEIVAASYASRTMMMSGLILAAFIVYHLLHFTVMAPGGRRHVPIAGLEGPPLRAVSGPICPGGRAGNFPGLQLHSGRRVARLRKGSSALR